ncbi:hypothetical protein [Luteolibacter luteus]|uniref:Uncharacterized protein n=1 Tax=Luteolibacter luteus TaxID=2728835 RepID=A0A858RM60_9BACT|nr:hypothetical protein [Luteolibacter luteus]QJE97548.1 hypothetical protein HHL09_17750 [Luteolibacter luteus]
MPSFVRFVAGFFLVFPGAAMWFFGAILLLSYSAAIPALIFNGTPPDALIIQVSFMGVAIALIAFGHSMIAAFDLLTSGRRYQLPGKHILPCIGMELLLQILGVTSFGISISALLTFWDLGTISPWAPTLLFLAGFAGCVVAIWIHRYSLGLRARWKAAHVSTQSVELPAE